MDKPEFQYTGFSKKTASFTNRRKRPDGKFSVGGNPKANITPNHKPKLYADVCPHCGGTNPTDEVNLPPNFSKNVNRELKRVIDDVYAGKITSGNIDTRLHRLVGKAIESQVTDGFGQTFSTVDFSTPDAEMLSRLTRDAWQFSAAKNYSQLRETTLALIDENGKARNFADFKDAAKNINSQYNEKWLRTEYNQAIGSSTMAARWAEYKANADSMPYLQYSTAGDENVRTEHQLLDGIIRKMRDEFWKQYYPPNGWGCRCSADQLAGSTATETEQIPNVTIPQMFRTNLAESGLIFPKGHPYYEGIPASTLRQAVQNLPDDVAYKNVYTNAESKGSVKMHVLHGINEMATNITMSKSLADNGYKVKLLPIIDTDKDDIRKLIYKTDNFIPGKNPDALINNELFEMKMLSNVNYKNLQRSIYRASKQANSVYVSINKTLANKQIEKPVIGLFNQSKTLKQVWIDNNGELIKLQNANYKK